MDDEVDYYALLGLDSTATTADIRKAYRQKSLKVHPDRNPDNPTAAALFHELTIAADLLSDPSKRTAFDTALAARNARKQRFAALDSKRKALAEDLLEREREFKRAKAGEASDKERKRRELERLKEEGRRLREQRGMQQVEEENRKREREEEEKVMRRAREQHQQGGAGGGGAVELGPLDKTLKVKWLKAQHPSLTTPEAVSAFVEAALAPQRADIDSVVLSSKTLSQPTKGKHGSGVVAFRTLSAAVRIIKGKEVDPDGKWAGFEVDWAAGAPPAALGGSTDAAPARAPSPPSAAPLPQTAVVDSDEDQILARLRQREREKLMDEMRLQDEAEGGA
ncbi:hypothetical protein Rhopal_001903-T1 [Rhodotorula paludigena]|uniref:J domain-containing protein n=1 Tax=Rhodotorula paludigena TaxID=86838 RepID=A0AAV5GHV2_9BASI|nr:hypothetical protein Rhopal_001903-T1 [Rhodotorula paludigena]